MNTKTSFVTAFACLAAASAFAEPIRLGSWNIRLAVMDQYEKDPRFPKWEARMPYVAAMIKAKKFDLMGLQEVCTQQADFLRAKFPEWGIVGVATNDAERSDFGHANAVFYHKERFRVIDWGWFAISETPDVPGSKSWNTKCVRSCTWAKMEDLADRREFFFFDTHFDHRSQEAREKGMALVLAEIRARNPKSLPVIMTGDFNSTAETPQIRLAKSSLALAYEISETPPNGPARTDNCWKYLPPEEETKGNRIDHIFLTRGTRVLSYKTFGDSYGDRLYPSDHFPVKAVIELETESPR